MQIQSPQSDDYSPIAEFYDLEHDLFDADLSMYRHVAEMVGDPVLELACGSGRILRALADPERRLVGVDNSAVMLERCQVRFADAPVQPELLLCDKSLAKLPAANFGVAIVGLNSLMHADTPARQLATLRVCREALDDRGLLVLDLPNPLLLLPDGADNRVHQEGSWESPSGAVVTKFSVQDLDPAAQTIRSSIWYDVYQSGGSVTRTRSSLTLRFIFRSELDLMLRAAGFVSAEYYGDYGLEPYLTESPRLIAFAECA
ncbi:MAG: class I SAM-dependent methyltransferase [Chloroflexota bacterium]|nr:class I SAM-dependent methyltransferase [Chloroflexota bacterium]